MRQKKRSEFGQRMYDAREAAGFSQAYVAEKLAIRQSTLSQLERSGLRSGRTVQMAALYGVDPVWLATGIGDMRSPEGGRLDGLTVAERAHLQHYRAMSSLDRLEIDRLTIERATRMADLRREVLADERRAAPAVRDVLRPGGVRERLTGRTKKRDVA